jgi:asparagine synthase (glutamine-hydrolysing)
MCGIAGIYNPKLSNSDRENLVRKMAEALKHRGPDAQGIWSNAKDLSLAHRRLSILDLSEAGAQPMKSKSERYIIVFNGEIYNFQDLRKNLETTGHKFRGHSDTEVLLALIDDLGPVAAIQKCVGMFAIAVWDQREQELYLLRDRLGEKPLYYGWIGDSFIFASELKPFMLYRKQDLHLNRQAIALYMEHNYIPAPHSIFLEIKKLEAAHWIQLKPQSGPQSIRTLPYWALSERIHQLRKHGSDSHIESEEEILESFETNLKKTIARQMVADVPLGAFLSGGLDSSSVVALMQAQSSRKVRTFTIGFHEKEFNEASEEKKIAAHLGTDHTEMFVTPQDSLDVVPHLAEIYDEPFADSSQIPTSLLARLTRQHVVVSLSGDGGDELMAGYNRYNWSQKLSALTEPMPHAARAIVSQIATSISEENWSRASSLVMWALPENKKMKHFGQKVHKLASFLGAKDQVDVYKKLIKHPWPGMPVLRAENAENESLNKSLIEDFSGIESMMYSDAMTYLPDDILVKVDRATMAASLESRTPFLDHEWVEYIWTLPLSIKIREGQGKWILRKTLEKYVPRELFERPKSGFAAPIGKWMRHELRDWCEELLDEKRLREEGLLNVSLIRQMWQEHLDEKKNWQYQLWNVLMLEAWIQKWRPNFEA